MYKNLQKLIYDLLHANELHGADALKGNIKRYSDYIRILIASLIILSVISVMLESVNDIEEKYSSLLYVLELVVIVVFSIEYILRLWSIVADHHHLKYRKSIVGRLRYVVSFMAIIDFIAIFPFFLPIFSVDFRFVRVVRLLRIVKIEHYSKTLYMLGTVLKKKKHELAVSLTIFTIMLVLASSCMFYLEHNSQPLVFSSIPSTMWWGVETLTTIGYGDVVPHTIYGKIFAGIISIMAVGIFAIPSGIIITGLIEETKEKQQAVLCERCKEIIKIDKN